MGELRGAFIQSVPRAPLPHNPSLQNAHKWNDIKLGDVNSILDCDRLYIFYNLYSLVSPEIIKLII